jgi:hypothetical protein
MPRDFLSSQIRTSQIVASRSLGTNPSLLIISSSNADGIGGFSPPLGAGSDTFLFVSGSRSTDAFVVLGGSAKVSGSLTVFDDTTFGETSGDLVSFVGRVNSNIIPSSTSLFSLGIPSRKWLEAVSLTGSFDYARVTSRAVFDSDMSGSLQRTAAGLPYLVAGTNVTITTASNGQITINSTAGGGGASYWSEASLNKIYSTGSVAVGINTSADSKGSDVFFFVSGSSGGIGTSGVSVFGGDLVVSGSTVIGNSLSNTLSIQARISSDIIPVGDRTIDLGSASNRFANVYTGDLHLRNDRGDYTLIEEEDCLTIRFNKSGKRYRFVLEPAPEFDER